MPDDTGFHFAYPLALWLLAAPILVLLWLRLTVPRESTERYRAYADARLLPFLLGRHDLPIRQQWKRWLGWSGLWILLVTALAGPRWDFTDVQLFRPGSDLVILLDLSESMDLADISPSRLTRARQEIQDLVEQNHHARLGLIGFATLAHVISPLTSDGGSLRSLLPALTTDLVELKGSRLTGDLGTRTANARRPTRRQQPPPAADHGRRFRRQQPGGFRAAACQAGHPPACTRRRHPRRSPRAGSERTSFVGVGRVTGDIQA